MLGDCTASQGPIQTHTSATMSTEEIIEGIPARNPLSSPPAKRLKQARLPFQVLDAKSPLVASSPSQNKRKLVDVPGKKKLDDTKPKLKKSISGNREIPIESGDNEVSSSSEAEPLNHNKLVDVKPHKKPSLLEKFVRTVPKQEEVTTSAPDLVEAIESNDEIKEENIILNNEKLEPLDSVADTIESVISASTMDTVDSTIESIVSSGIEEPNSTNNLTKSTTDIPKATIDTPKSTTDTSKSTTDTPKSTTDTPKSTTDTPRSTHSTPVQHRPISSFFSSPKPTSNTAIKSMLEKTPGSTHDKTPLSNSLLETPKSSKTSPRNTEDAPSTSEVDAPSTIQSNTQESDTPNNELDTSSNSKTPNSGKKAKLAVDRQKKKEEREKEKQEKLKKREEEKAEKEKLRLEEKERKEKEKADAKAKRDQEIQEKKELKEKERLEKLAEKEEEKKKKQAIIDAKNEEKRKKEDEKKQLEEKKKRDEEEKKKKDEQTKKAFFGAFFKAAPKIVTAPKVESQGPFMPFQVKKHMKMAAKPRPKLENTEEMDSMMSSQDSKQLYLDLLKSKGHTALKGIKTWPWPEDQKDEVVEVGAKGVKRYIHVKFLKFRGNEDNHFRPAYYGTWKKTSKHVTGRNPLGLDKNVFDYEYDSDDDWEEEEPGESLSDSEKEDDDAKEEKMEQDDEEDDGFFVPHGYLSDDEGGESADEDSSPGKMKARQLLKAKAFDNDMKKKCDKMKSLCMGCVYLDQNIQQTILDTLQQFEACSLLGDFSAPIPTELSGGMKNLTLDDPEARSRTPTVDDLNSSANSGVKHGSKKPVPDEALPDLIRLVHMSTQGCNKLKTEFKEFWKRKCMGTLEQKVPVATDSNEPMEIDGTITPGTCQSPVPNGPSPRPDNSNSPQNDQSTTLDIGTTQEYLISNRQLEKTIRSIAVWERREDVKRLCWNVKQDILEMHNLTDLIFPNEWVYCTKKNKAKEETGRNTPGGKPTKVTTPTPKPTTSTTPKAKNSITQFTVTLPPPKETGPVNLVKPKPIPAPQQFVSNMERFQAMKKITTSPGSLGCTPLSQTATGSSPLNTGALASNIITSLAQRQTLSVKPVQHKTMHGNPIVMAVKPVNKPNANNLHPAFKKCLNKAPDKTQEPAQKFYISKPKAPEVYVIPQQPKQQYRIMEQEREVIFLGDSPIKQGPNAAKSS
ncbi:unnamed protein product [Owenia fusiformis]|uniref:Chromatin assembly factor 1 subunit A n=1 Tax=Owenia fusiformis TaxID=6347 RepID=A0A8J1TUT1_OWEFU|nr:unnamed protein product [Owenia fusiformis]